MRENIYYWKCDSSLPPEEKRKLFFKDKYSSESFLRLANRCVELWQGEPPASITGADCDGNHFAFIVTLRSGTKVFLRGDEGAGDDYMIAETAAMTLAAQHGIPVPKTLFSSVADNELGANFQILEWVDHKTLDTFHKDGSIKLERIAAQLGLYLQQLHAIKIDGFGFLDTSALKAGEPMRGLCGSYTDYFHTKLDEHLNYLEQSAFLAHGEIANIRAIIKDGADVLKIGQGSLTHRDAALWNVLGTPTDIKAIIDWDDCVSGEPADDLGMLLCLYNPDFTKPLLNSYANGTEPDAPFMRKVWLHMLRNMLWKAKLRDSLGYFDRGAGFFINMPGESASLKETTRARIRNAIDYFKNTDKQHNREY